MLAMTPYFWAVTVYCIYSVVTAQNLINEELASASQRVLGRHELRVFPTPLTNSIWTVLKAGHLSTLDNRDLKAGETGYQSDRRANYQEDSKVHYELPKTLPKASASQFSPAFNAKRVAGLGLPRSGREAPAGEAPLHVHWHAAGSSPEDSAPCADV